jgi:hypothetical protein
MSVRLSVCISRKTDAAGRQLGGGLRSKDDRELDIHTHTTRERHIKEQQMLSKINSETILIQRRDGEPRGSNN